MQGIKQVLLIYDIICQWFKYFKDCVAQLDYLTIPEELQLLFTIGDFHVKGHVIEHFTCFSLQFIKGVGVIDGEIVETLWSVLNKISQSARGDTLANWNEILDNHMNPSNWKKLTSMGVSPQSSKGYPWHQF